MMQFSAWGLILGVSLPHAHFPRSFCIHHAKFCDDTVVWTCTQWGINWDQQRHFQSNFQRRKVSFLLCNQTLSRSLLLIVTFFWQDAWRQVTGNSCISDHFNRTNMVCTEGLAFLALQSFSWKGHLTFSSKTLYKEENVKLEHILQWLM